MDAIARIERALGSSLAGASVPGAPPLLAAAMHHAVFPRGARLRSRLCLAVALACGDDDSDLSDAAAAAIELLRLSPQVAGITLMTHFADADGERGVAWQEARCAAMLEGLGDCSISAANSAALIAHPQAARAWARPGIMLYGASPIPANSSAAELGLRPVMTLASQLIALRDLAPGDRVGYGGAFVAERPTRIGIVACGYADGYPRHAGTGTPVLVEGRRTRLLGRVSMDKLCVDLTGIAGARQGSPVMLWGDGLAADEVASAAGTVAYELFCALAARVPVIESA